MGFDFGSGRSWSPSIEEMGSVTLLLLLLAMSSYARLPVEIGADFWWVADRWLGRRKVCHEFGDDAVDGHRSSDLVICLLLISTSWDQGLPV
ncbi:hypothetical protein ACLOJK_004719 [Asimina triloba]